MALNKWKTGDRLKLEWRYVICPLAFLIVLWVAASFTGHWATEENPYRSYALQACAWLNGRLDLEKDYPWLELAIYEGKYYVSFPPFPSLVLLPFAAFIACSRVISGAFFEVKTTFRSLSAMPAETSAT